MCTKSKFSIRNYNKRIILVCKLFQYFFIGSLDPGYKQNITILDSLIGQIPMTQSLHVDNKRFMNGVSEFVKTAISGAANNKDIGAGSLGGLDHQYVPSLVIQMILCIGTTGDLLPNKQNWIPKSGNYIKFNHLGNITEIVMSCGYMVLDLYLALQREEYSLDQLRTLFEMCRTAQVHLHCLYMLKQFLCNSTKPYCGIKVHMLGHFPTCIWLYGMAKIFDMIRFTLYLTFFVLHKMLHLYESLISVQI